MKFILYPVVFAVGLLIGYGISVQAPSEAVPAETLQIETIELNEMTDIYAIHARYPQFGVSVIDEQIRGTVEGAAMELKSLPPNPEDSATPQNSLDVSFGSVYVGPGVVSTELVLSQYTGGAHPLTLISGMNFDRETGRLLLLADALELIGQTIEQVSAKATEELGAKLGEAFFPEGTDTNPENFSSFTISADTVTFIFQQYQAGPYAAGPQKVSFTRK